MWPWRRASPRAATLLAESAPLFQAIGNPLYVPWCLEGRRCGAREGRAALLCRARDTLRERLGAPLRRLSRGTRTAGGHRRGVGEDGFARNMRWVRAAPEGAFAQHPPRARPNDEWRRSGARRRRAISGSRQQQDKTSARVAH
jgi:hypothetical protein